MRYTFLTPLKFFLLVGFLSLLAACSTNSAPSAKETAPYYVAPVDIDSNAKQADIEKLYGAKAVVFKPEAGFAILGFNNEAAGLTLLGKPADQNVGTISSPAVSGQGYSAWASGYSAWSSGFSAWAGGFNINDPLTYNWAHWTLIGLADAHTVATNLGAGVKVAVIDTGLDLTHPAFATSCVTKGKTTTCTGPLAPATEWKDFVDGDTIPQEVSGQAYGHGTGVAGVILQIAPKAQILPIRVLGPDGSGNLTSVVSAIDWAIQKGAKVINLSLGATGTISSLQTILDYATSQGVYIVASSGNTGDQNITYPAQYMNDNTGTFGAFSVSVGSTTLLDYKSGFSTYGSGLEMLAPGEFVTTTYPDSKAATWSGTSFAAPMVTGAIALALGDPVKANAELAKTVSSSASNIISINGSSFSGMLGSGRLDVSKFIRSVHQ